MLKSYLPRGNAAYINKMNKVNVLDLIRRRGTISRAQIVEESGLSAPTVTRIVDSLIHDEELVEEAGMGSSSAGRPPLLIQMHNDINAVIGIDLGSTAIRGVLANLSAGVLAEVETHTPLEAGFGKVMESVIEVIERLLNTAPARNKRIHGIGLAVAGLINSKTRVVEFSPDFDWVDVDIHQALNGRFDCPVIFDNVTRVMAMGELWHGEGSNYRDFVCVNVGYGIGAGIVSNGRPFGGAEGLAGEFGHITLEEDSQVQCKCGNYGCLEALASGRGIALAACRALETGRESVLGALCEGDLSRISAEMVSRAANEGDALAREVLGHAANFLGIGIAALVNLFNPQAVFLGGGVTRNNPLLFDTINDVVAKRVMPRLACKIKILPVTHGMNATVMGAVALILDKVVNLQLGAPRLAHKASQVPQSAPKM